MHYNQEYNEIYRMERPSICPSYGAAILKNIVKSCREFCNKTSIHGFYHIAAPRRHWVERMLWITATALAVWGAVDVSLGQLQRYNESPTVVTLEKDFRSWRFSLPAITVCYKDRMDLTKLPSVIKNFWNVDPADEKYAYYSRFVDAVANSDLLHLERFQEFSSMDSKVDMFQIAVDVMPEVQIKTMSSEGTNFKWIPVMTEVGACYATNSLALTDVAITKLNPNGSVGLPVSCKYSSLSCFIMMDIASAADFFLHSPYDIMDLTYAPSEIFLTLTRNTELSVMETRCGRGVKDLQPKRRRCLYHDEPSNSGRRVHSTNTCRLACRSRLAMKLCGCIPFYYFYEDGPQCTPANMSCLANFWHRLSNNDGEKCSCAPQCMDCNYKEITTTDQIWNRLPFKLRGSVKFIVQAPRTRYTREIVFHFQDLVVSFGGAAGLFLGASFISFVEILYFLLAKLFRVIIKKEEKAAVKVEEAGILHEALRIKHLTAILETQKQFQEYDITRRY